METYFRESKTWMKYSDKMKIHILELEKLENKTQPASYMDDNSLKKCAGEKRRGRV